MYMYIYIYMRGGCGDTGLQSCRNVHCSHVALQYDLRRSHPDIETIQKEGRGSGERRHIYTSPSLVPTKNTSLKLHYI